MACNLRTLGLVLSAIFAMSAMVASSASAQGKLKSDGPVTLTMAFTGGSSTATTMFGERIECPGTVYKGHKYNETPHRMIPSGSTTITLSPNYAKPCTSDAGGQVTILMNGCDYVLHIGSTAGGKAGTYTVTTDLVCPMGAHLQIEVFSGTKHEAATRTCTRTIKPQAGIAGAHLTDTPESGTLLLGGTFKGIHVEQSGTCGTATTSTGEFDFDVTLKGTTEVGSPTALAMSHTEAGQGLLTSDGPVTLTGSDNGPTTNAFTAFGASTECSSGTYTGHKLGSTTEPVESGSTTVTITPDYEQPCSATGGRQATIEMNGCDYVLHVGGKISASTFGVTTDIVCPEGKTILFSVWNAGSAHEVALRFCTLGISSQTGLSGAHLTSTPSSDDLNLNGTFTGVKALRTGSCLADGKGLLTAEGKLHVDATVTGTNAKGEATGITVE
jgi:hypothetical protein